MTVRTQHFTVRFAAPFSLYGIDEIQPAGDYAVEQDEKLVNGKYTADQCRIATFIHLPGVSGPLGKVRLVPVDPSELDEAVRQED
ncbi:hypothetical protein [Hoeflea poritis]|uniref:Uncharacterized protein n=1 Tax=Hoeflea poritis TaxID=2993659 RepID=A0ABT4VVW8_9HYPH|nr:hypothetical protein [Hoeflea poritis]MDA4848862.1 hypothetical protein [Hoeflea poritis]